MAKIRTILWDVGGVLLTNGWDHCERADLFREFQIDRDDFESRHEEVNDAWEKGEITVDEYLDQTLFYEPRSFTREEFIARMQDMSQWLPHTAIGLVRRLAVDDDLKLAMLSNESRELMEYRIHKFGLDQDFSAYLVSAYVGLRKPDPRIFQLALDVTQSTPEETIFVDDRRENAAAASALGIHGVHYEGPQRLEEELKRLGLKLSDRQL
ncbi:MAG: HAD family phosphatase [Acidobacteria bacterium]|jgi:putative hydrolase of the HAD superfamily|nr:HAD family phosphatase [Acidobacteriota bacterium]